MKLEQFKEIADENLKDLYVDERLVQRIHLKTCTTPIERTSRVPRAAYYIAAACAAVMLLSGSVLVKTLPGAQKGNGLMDAGTQTAVTALRQPQTSSASTLSAQLETSVFIDGSILSYGIAEIGAFNEGFAPALASNGLYGYVNEERIWVVRALYDEADEVLNGKASVKVQGVTQIIEIP